MNNVKKAREIKNAQISFVSLVDKAANKREFIITKAENGKANWKTGGRIIQKDSDNHYVTGVVYEPMKEDSQGDFMSAEEITKAAYSFIKNGEGCDVQHSFKLQKGVSVVESWIAKADFEVDGEQITKGTWLITAEISNKELWDKIEKSEITGFSMGGKASYGDDVDLDSVDKSEKQGILSKLAKMLGLGQEDESVAKAGKKISGKNKETLNGIYESLGTFLKEFEEPEPNDNTNNNIDKEEQDMTKPEVEKLINESIEKALTKGSPENANDDVQKSADTGITAEFIEKTVQAAIAKAMTPKEDVLTAEQVQKMVSEAVGKAVEPIRKAAGLPTNLNDEQVEKNDNRHYLYGLL